MLDRVEVQMPRHVAMQQRAGGDHLGVQPRVPGDQAMEERGNGGRSSPSSARRTGAMDCKLLIFLY